MRKILFVCFALIFIAIAHASLVQGSMEISNLPKEILIERGWSNYITATVVNSGNSTLSNVLVYFDGENSKWMTVVTNKTGFVQPGRNTSFVAKIDVPLRCPARHVSVHTLRKVRPGNQ